MEAYSDSCELAGLNNDVSVRMDLGQCTVVKVHETASELKPRDLLAPGCPVEPPLARKAKTFPW